MNKSNKIEIKNCEIEEVDEGFYIKYTDSMGKEKEIDLYEVVKTILSKTQTGVFDLLLKDHINRKKPNRKPRYKYRCPNCNKEIISEIEDLHAQCKDCNIDYVKEKNNNGSRK